LEKEMESDSKSQSDKFKQAAREHGADEDEGRWEERLKRVARGNTEKQAPRNPVVPKKK